MSVDGFATPVGTFRVYRNSEICPFFIEESKYNTVWLKENVAVQPEGCYKISLDLIRFSIGDTITCELDNGDMDNDGGDEHTLNIVGENGDYIIGIGTIDSDSMEESYFE